MNPSSDIKFNAASKLIAVFLIILAAVFITFSDVLNLYFTCDDFWHFGRLSRAFDGEPLLLFENFWKPWLEKTNIYIFYRPFTELSLAVDYLFFRGNASGYHFSNLIYHTCNATLVYLTTRQVVSIWIPEETNSAYNFIAPLLASLLFALYPMNLEPIAWIAARADLVGTFFYLFTIYTFLLHCRTEKKYLFVLSTLSFIAAVLSKESSATAPFLIFVLYAFFLKSKTLDTNRTLIARSSLKKTLVFWVVLFVYIIVRSIALGDVVGGYIGSMRFILAHNMLERLVMPLTFWKLFHPINTALHNQDGPLEITLRVAYALTAILVIANAVLSKTISRRAKLIAGCFFSLAIFFAINIQVWAVTDQLFGARIIYAMAVPLSILTVFLVIPLSKDKLDKLLVYPGIAITLGFITLFSLIAKENVVAWIACSKEVRAIQKCTIDELKEIPEGNKLAVFNLPAAIDGTIAFFSTDFTEGLFQPPLADQDYSTRIVNLDGTHINTEEVNYQLLREALRRRNINLYKWSRTLYKLRPIDKEIASANLNPGPAFRFKLDMEFKGRFKKPDQYQRMKLNSVFENSTAGEDLNSYLIKLPPHLIGAESYLLEVDLTNETGKIHPEKSNLVNQLENILEPPELAFVSWSDRVKSDEKPVNFPFSKKLFRKTRGRGVLRLQIFDSKQLSMEPAPKEIRIDIPVHAAKVDAVYLVSKSKVIPEVHIKGDYPFLPNGIYKIPASEKAIKIKYDTTGLGKAKKTICEISKPDCQFELYPGSFRAVEVQKDALKTKELARPELGEFQLHRDEFKKTPANYQIRIAAMNENDEIIGTFSDPISFYLE